MKHRNFLQSLNDAVQGFIYVIKHERNMRVHFIVAFCVLMLAIVLGVSRVEWLLLATIIAVVLVAEMMNTAVEELVDAVFKQTHSPAARTIKHISAGFVLVSAFSALVIGFLIFSNYLRWPFEATVFKIRHAMWHTTFVALLVVLFIIISGKAMFGRGTPFRGGALSGHSAVAFSLWTAVVFTQENLFVISATFLLACLVGQSRMRAKIHSFWEVVSGAAIGVLITSMFFQLLR